MAKWRRGSLHAATRWLSVGRLDINSSGLLLFTDDGELAHRLTHPSSGLTREYMVRLYPQPSEQDIDRVVNGISIDGEMVRFEEVVPGPAESDKVSNRWFCVVVTEGRNRMVRHIWKAVGCQVSRLIRVRYGPIILPREIHTGQIWELDREDRTALLDAIGA